MRRKVDDRVGKLLSLLDEGIAGLEQLGYADTAKILQIAKLDLKMTAHEISAKELRALCQLLANKQTENEVRASVIQLPQRPTQQPERVRRP